MPPVPPDQVAPYGTSQSASEEPVHLTMDELARRWRVTTRVGAYARCDLAGDSCSQSHWFWRSSSAPCTASSFAPRGKVATAPVAPSPGDRTQRKQRGGGNASGPTFDGAGGNASGRTSEGSGRYRL